MTKAKNRMATGNEIKAAHALRRELAEKHNVCPSFISLSDCIKEVSGRSIGVIRDVFGNQLGYDRSRINYFMLTESGVAIDIEEIANAIGRSFKYIRTQFDRLQRKGILRNDYGFVSLRAEKRPFPQPMAD